MVWPQWRSLTVYFHISSPCVPRNHGNLKSSTHPLAQYWTGSTLYDRCFVIFHVCAYQRSTPKHICPLRPHGSRCVSCSDFPLERCFFACLWFKLFFLQCCLLDTKKSYFVQHYSFEEDWRITNESRGSLTFAYVTVLSALLLEK